jgi:hypothetical protein
MYLIIYIYIYIYIYVIRCQYIGVMSLHLPHCLKDCLACWVPATVYLFIHESEVIIASLSLSPLVRRNSTGLLPQAFEGKPLIWGSTHPSTHKAAQQCAVGRSSEEKQDSVLLSTRLFFTKASCLFPSCQFLFYKSCMSSADFHWPIFTETCNLTESLFPVFVQINARSFTAIIPVISLHRKFRHVHTMYVCIFIWNWT